MFLMPALPQGRSKGHCHNLHNRTAFISLHMASCIWTATSASTALLHSRDTELNSFWSPVLYFGSANHLLRCSTDFAVDMMCDSPMMQSRQLAMEVKADTTNYQVTKNGTSIVSRSTNHAHDAQMWHICSLGIMSYSLITLHFLSCCAQSHQVKVQQPCLASRSTIRVTLFTASQQLQRQLVERAIMQLAGL